MGNFQLWEQLHKGSFVTKTIYVEYLATDKSLCENHKLISTKQVLALLSYKMYSL